MHDLVTHAYVHRLADLHLAGFAPAFAFSFHDRKFARNPPVLIASVDTVKFDDHSMLNHQNATWSWEITPAPAYISNANVRNPKAVFDVPGKYTVTLKVNKGGVEYSKTIQDMFEIKSCPSVNDCSNPGELPKNIWKLVYADSYQPGNEPAKAFDGNPATIWHTAWGSNEPQPPHEIRIDLGKSYSISKMIELSQAQFNPLALGF